jgi:DNA invertase Pin-like site-specific DNA recombinase
MEPTMTTNRNPLAFIYDRQTSPTVGVVLMRVAVCRQYAEERGYEIAGEWHDTGDNALTDHRPQFDRMLTEMLATRVGGRDEIVCLVNDFDRLSHNPHHRTRFIRRVQAAGGWVENCLGEKEERGGTHSHVGRPAREHLS